ncbi:T9SS type A sorting domain-containing protein [Owenweeksia hongkongensis]|uniref:T9SS type A sorting domain-containing protein n=1 Tax=Owenweeksia hongkongensis TaxID=253245 RepID=UPI003A8F4D6D
MYRFSMSCFIITLALFATVAKSQHSFINSYHTSNLNGAELTVYQYANFMKGVGTGKSCPPLDSLHIERVGNTITVDALYDPLGTYPAFGCTQIDTIIDTIMPCNPCTLVLNTHVLQLIPPSQSIDTAYYADRDTSYFSYLSSSNYKLESDLEIYPNPASDFLYLKGENLSKATFKLLDISGREVRLFDGNTRRLDLQGIMPGVYCVRVESEDGRLLVRKVIVD